VLASDYPGYWRFISTVELFSSMHLLIANTD
jgi:hypothetical protein